jgi:hypothetical protein
MAGNDKGLRKALWNSGTVDGRDIGEALRDLDGAQKLNVRVRVVERAVTYAPPIFLNADSIPAAVFLGRCKQAKTFTSVSAVAVAWTWTGSQVRIDSIPTLTVGTPYEMAFLVIG